MKKSVKDVDVKGKKVFVRCDFNVPLDGDCKITDDMRIRSAMPTVKYLVDNGARVILCSHLGRPKGKPVASMSLAPVAERISELLGKKIVFAASDAVVDKSVRNAVDELKDGDVMLLENVRFRAEEEKNDPDFANELAGLGEIFVNDAFGTAHRAHASTAGVADYLPAVCGFLVEKEVTFFNKALENPERPFTAVLGGAKVADKLLLIENLMDKVDNLIIGGGMAFTFIKALGHPVGKSLVDEEKLELAKKLMMKAAEMGVKFLLPVDAVAAKEISDDAESAAFDVDQIPEDQMGLDIGPKTADNFRETILASKTVFWNGPMGVFETDQFAAGTKAVARALEDCQGVTIVGGGDSAAAMEKFGMGSHISHISTGGGASIEFLEGKKLPGIECIADK